MTERSRFEKVNTIFNAGSVAVGFIGFVTGNPALFAAAALDLGIGLTVGDHVAKKFSKKTE